MSTSLSSPFPSNNVEDPKDDESSVTVDCTRSKATPTSSLMVPKPISPF